MKIAHVDFIGHLTPGFRKKFQDQAEAARRTSLPIDFLVVNPQLAGESDHLRWIRIPAHRNRPTDRFRAHFGKCRWIDRLVDLRAYDRIILRYPFPVSSGAVDFVKKHPGRIITEHHTNELGELDSFSKTPFRPGRYFMVRIAARLERTYAPRFLRESLAIIAVTEEIRRVELEKSGPKPSAVISNGIDVDSVPLRRRPDCDGTTLRLIFAASVFSPWQGLDRVLLGLEAYVGRPRIHMSLVGVIPAHFRRMIERVRRNSRIALDLTGELSGPALDRLFDRSHISIAPLALFRNNMRQACGLKTRDQIARGIPLVYAYDDTDLSGGEDFALKLPANDSPVDFGPVARFAEEASRDDGLPARMREFARQKLDWRIKVRQMYEFAAGVQGDESLDRSSGFPV